MRRNERPDGSCWVADATNGQVVRLAYYYTLTFTGDSGQIAVDGVSHALPWAEDSVIGSLVTLEALPDATSDFLGWSDDFSGAANPMTITADADYTIGVDFSGAGHALALAASGEGTILVNGVERDPGSSAERAALPLARRAWPYHCAIGQNDGSSVAPVFPKDVLLREALHWTGDSPLVPQRAGTAFPVIDNRRP